MINDERNGCVRKKLYFLPPRITQKGEVPARYVTICYIPLPFAARYVTICYKVKSEWRRYVTKKLLLHSVAIRATLCNKLLHTVSLLHTVVHHSPCEERTTTDRRSTRYLRRDLKGSSAFNGDGEKRKFISPALNVLYA